MALPLGRKLDGNRCDQGRTQGGTWETTLDVVMQGADKLRNEAQQRNGS